MPPTPIGGRKDRKEKNKEIETPWFHFFLCVLRVSVVKEGFWA